MQTPDQPTAIHRSPDSEYAQALLKTTRDELRFADAKSAALFTVISVAVGLGTGLAATSHWGPSALSTPGRVLAVLSIVALLLSSLLSGAAIYPRAKATLQPEPYRVAYFGDVVRFRNPRNLELALQQTVQVTHEVTCAELLAVSLIARTKYRLIALSLWLLLAGVLFAALAYLIR